MKIYLPCQACMPELGIENLAICAAEVQDGRIANFTCGRGHTTTTVLQLEKHELLAEIAVTAIFDGYYREAISSFSASLERFFELYIRTLSADEKLDAIQFDKTWKLVKAQSERQFGAFAFLYFLEERVAPPSLSQRTISFRNKVIHQGLIPTRNEAVDFGQEVLDVITPAMDAVVLRRKDAMWSNLTRNLLAACEKLSADGHSVSTTKWPTLLDWLRTEQQGQPTVEEWLIHIEKTMPPYQIRAGG